MLGCFSPPHIDLGFEFWASNCPKLFTMNQDTVDANTIPSPNILQAYDYRKKGPTQKGNQSDSVRQKTLLGAGRVGWRGLGTTEKIVSKTRLPSDGLSI